MKIKAKHSPLVDWSKITIDPNIKSSKDSAFVQKKVNEAKQTLERLRKSGVNLF
jgi:hypothetical protein